MKYQILKNNQLIEISEEEYNYHFERDKYAYGNAYIYLSDCREVLTLIPFQNIRLAQVKLDGDDYLNYHPKHQIKRD